MTLKALTRRSYISCGHSWAQVSLVLPSLQDRLGPGATYLLFAGVGVAAVATIAAIVPVLHHHCTVQLFV